MKSFILYSLLILGMLGISALCQAVQVDGYCYLENQFNHEGTRVLFEADTPSAETDSAFTDSTGYYQIDLIAGGYDVYFTHAGFQGDSLINRLLVSPTTLPNVTLIELPHGVYISGALSGYLVDTTYVLAEEAWVEQGDSLFMEAGATLYFIRLNAQYLAFRIYGFLSAIGTETDSIKFISYPGLLTWNKIAFWDSEDTSRFEYCLFSGFRLAGTQCVRSSPTFTNCTITNNGTAIGCGESQPVYSYCTITGNNYYQISLTLDGNAVIDHCIIGGGPGEGIWCSDASPTISNCTITGNGAQGIRCADTTTAVIINTVIANNWIGISFDDISPNVSVTYCDFYGNSYGNFTGYPPPYLGQIVGVNNNGDPCDIFYNIFLNPMLTGNYHPQAGSPCIDAGDPTYPYDPDSTIADIGAFFYDQSSISDPLEIPQPTEFHLSQNYPNPFNASTVLRYSLPQPGIVTLTVHNILGQKVVTLFDGRQQSGVHAITWDASDVSSGIYFAQLQNKSHVKTIKMVLTK